ncbi:MAG: hypothetical protein WD355_00805 [Balneolaceae bacterium]
MSSSNTRASVIIEFAGVSGSGKSSLVRELEKEMSEAGYDVSWEYIVNATRVKRLFEKIGTFFVITIASPVKALQIINECLKNYRYGPEACRDILNIFYLLYRYRKARKASSPEIWIFDQGLVQACWSVLMFGSRDSKILDLIWEDIQYVVIVSASPDIAWNRLEKRPYKGSRVQQKMKSQYFTKYADSYMNQILVKLQSGLPAERLLIVENNNQLSQSSGETIQWVISAIRKRVKEPLS